MDSWETIRDQVLQRDNWVCQVCGKSTSGQVHHIIPRRSGGSDTLTNLITLCGRCHVLISPVPDWVLTKVWRIPPAQIKSERSKVRDTIDGIRMYPR
ncbi:MAG: HNH endonuclease [Bacteroidota bacterium]|nr:HNH endonuclease [Bacteroidota bacterium]